MKKSPKIGIVANLSKIILQTNFDMRNQLKIVSEWFNFSFWIIGSIFRLEIVSEWSDYSFLIIASLDENSPKIENITFPGQRRVHPASL